LLYQLFLIGASFVMSLTGCVGHTQAIPALKEENPDCSFRSPTTCWTMSGRFPSRNANPPEPLVDSLPEQPPELVSRSDSTVPVP
jgi:hypothetical protein